jgi:hypothetical protein
VIQREDFARVPRQSQPLVQHHLRQVAMSPGLVVMRAGVPRPYPWQPRFGDMIADDWIVGTIEKVRAVLGA